MAVRIGALPGSALISRKLVPTRMVLCASPAYLERHGTPRHLQATPHIADAGLDERGEICTGDGTGKWRTRAGSCWATM